MFNSQVYIGPEFFKKTLQNDYADPWWSIAREILQNGVDAPGCNRIDVTIKQDGSNTVLTVKNDGAPMTEDELINKLLALGGSGKNFEGTVGGMGAAKLVLYFAHKSYRIHTGDMLVTGSGAGYNLEKAEFLNGTESIIVIEGNNKGILQDNFEKFLELSQWRGDVFINEKEYVIRLPKGRLRRELDWCRIHTNSDQTNMLVVRAGGLAMHTRYISYKGCVVVELLGPSCHTLQTSRDNLKSRYSRQLDDFIINLAVNRTKALKQPEITRRHYKGFKLLVNKSLIAALSTPDSKTPEARSQKPETKEQEQTAPRHVDFFLKSTLGVKIPAYFKPDEFSNYSKMLLDRWVGLLMLIADITDYQEPFSVGFLFDTDNRAEVETTSEHGRIVYVNPVAVNEKTKSLSNYWGFTSAGNWELLSTAIHEFVHLTGYSDHDEQYANRLTETTTVVFKNLKRFRRFLMFGEGRRCGPLPWHRRRDHNSPKITTKQRLILPVN